jgi:hypothetical protein
VFAGGVARWLGVSVERAPELDRAMLTSVPYAMKAAEAESLAGHAASDFVTQEQLAALSAPAGSPAPAFRPETGGTVTGSGTDGTVPLWTGALTQGNSEIVQVGSDIGINEATPTAMLDVGGSENVQGVLGLPAYATATTTAGWRSQLVQFVASAWSTTTNAPVAPTFKLFVDPEANNTATPSGALEFQYQLGSNIANVLAIGSTGLISFAPGQTFPETIKSVSATSPVTAATTAGAVTVGLNTTALETTLNSVYAQLGAANTFTKPITFAPGQTFPGGTGGGTITGITTTSPLTGSGTSGSVALGLNTGALLPAITPPLETTFNTIYPQLSAQNSFTNNNAFSGTISSQGTLNLVSPGVTSSFAPNLNSALLELSANAYNSTEGIPEALNFGWQAVATGGNTGSPGANLELLYGSGSTQPAATGLSIAPSGVVTFASGQTFPGGGGGGGITGITTSSPLTGSGTSGTVNLGLNASVLETTLDAVYPQLNAANTFSTAQTVTTSAVTGLSVAATGGSSTGVSGSGNSYGVYGTSGYTGVYGQSTSGGVGVYGAGAIGVQANGTANGVRSSSSSPGGASVSSDDTSGSGAGVLGASGTVPAVQAGAGVQGSGPNYGVYGAASSNTGIGVAGVSGTSFGVYGDSITPAAGVAGVFGFTSAEHSSNYAISAGNSTWAGVWADTTGTYDPTGNSDPVALVATADDTIAGFFYNNSQFNPTVSAYNSYSGGPTGLFKILRATGSGGTCGIGSGGDLSCTGRMKALVSVGGGARKVETYAMQSPENWMEDFGSGVLQEGVAVIKIDPAFAETVSETADYHVFLTPKADSKGLYVFNETATSFEVRESSGGTSSLSFDYRVVAKRRGYEAQRLTDVTERFNAETARAMPSKATGAPRDPSPQRLSLGTPGTQGTARELPRIHPGALTVGAGHPAPAIHP